MRTLIIILIISQFIAAQHIEESKITCSHAFTAENLSTSKISHAKSQSDYDVTFYNIDLQIFPDNKSISGSVGIFGESLINDLTNIEVNLSDHMDVDSVKTLTGVSLNYNHINNIVNIELANIVGLNNEFKFVIFYQGSPQSTGFGSFKFDTVYNKPMISTLSEPYGARDWWPCKDTPLDKADSVNISVKVPKEFVVASNGLRKNVIDNGDWKTYYWEERYPIATYLVSLAIYPYLELTDWYKYNPF